MIFKVFNSIRGMRGHMRKQGGVSRIYPENIPTVTGIITIHKYKYTNTNIQIHKYKYSNTNTQLQILEYKNIPPVTGIINGSTLTSRKRRCIWGLSPVTLVRSICGCK